MLAGAIGPQLPAELLRFCESTTLSGTLTLWNGGHRVEVGYRGGEIEAISVAGDTDLHAAWAWTTGQWTIEARVLVEAETGRPSPIDATGRQFLNVVEQALADILDDAEKALPEPRRDTLGLTVPLVVRRREPTVRIYYVRDTGKPPTPPQVPAPVAPSRFDLTTEITELEEVSAARVRPGPPPHAAPERLASPWIYALATLGVAAAAAFVLWALDR